MATALKQWGNGRQFPPEFSLHHGNLLNHIEEGNVEQVRAFLTSQPQWLSYYYFERSLLHLAAEYDNPDVVAVLVELGMDVNTPQQEYPWGALYTAVLRERLLSAKWLLEHGAHPKYEFRGLTFSCGTLSSVAEGKLEMVKLLVEHGAPVDILVDDPPRSLLTTATQFGHTEVADYLRSIGALTEEEIKTRAKGKRKKS